MHNVLKNIILKNSLLFIFACCVFEKTSISVISQIFEGFQQNYIELSIADFEDGVKESEQLKENLPRENWIPLHTYSIELPELPKHLIAYNNHCFKSKISFFPTVFAPPPNWVV